ncbi:prolipoprotein diacylglyceryl transferase family protein [Synergistes jonesii]|uniref:Diacylglyceryl transferase n=1 Tax=Synergistes jonesii TaxID=2754 RepID=A0A073IP55_9BACT|nr:prolipoprotein diacylglyceryl transferase family protein [Synergistes jonesii]KEJ91360.1 hypothetical protein EH55_10980 [Synergistes jonesii]OFB60425.1 hypothetical protein JS73_11850 [Synergistes jonesii]OFB61250.1 hypothetical protein JS79_12000 [Synergistes jonesii]OFB62867.1 hypothetical protein JS72_07430 [Synergistes jonesii]OFB66636.1 hypothetical protein JS78_11870 [Synergistes jonesii]
MFPVILKISFLEVRSYYVLWASALFIFVAWTRRRAERLWGMEDGDVTSVLLRVYCAGVLGSYAAAVTEKLPRFFAGEIALGAALSGLESWGGILAGGLTALWSLKKRGMRIEAFAESAALPAAAMMAVGRIGCFLEGCCAGVGKFYASPPCWTVHMRNDARGFYRFPSQLAESLLSFASLLLLLAVEKYLRKKRGGTRHAFCFPLYMLLYSLYRLLFDAYREAVSPEARVLWAAAALAGVLWLAASFIGERCASRG